MSHLLRDYFQGTGYPDGHQKLRLLIAGYPMAGKEFADFVRQFLRVQLDLVQLVQFVLGHSQTNCLARLLACYDQVWISGILK